MIYYFSFIIIFFISSGNHLLIMRSKNLLNLSEVLVQVSIVGFVNWIYFTPLIKDQNYVFYNSRQTKPDQCNGLWAMETTIANHARCMFFSCKGAVVSVSLIDGPRYWLIEPCMWRSAKCLLQIVHCNSTCGSSYRQPALPRYSVQFLSLSLSWGQVNTTKLWLTCHNHLGQLINVLCGLGEASSTRVPLPPLHQIIHQLEYNYIFCNSMRDAN